MVLAHQNRPMSEGELVTILGTQSFGTPISHVSRLAAYRCQVTYRSFSTVELKDSLLAGMPVIARVWTGMLTYWSQESFHVVVVAGYDDEWVYLHDPAFADAPQAVSWDSFLAAWAEYDEAAVIIEAQQ
jgi:ABC-type bacteriocin/lantibiotic exporter with double-glycine peptidase domain